MLTEKGKISGIGGKKEDLLDLEKSRWIRTTKIVEDDTGILLQLYTDCYGQRMWKPIDTLERSKRDGDILAY